MTPPDIENLSNILHISPKLYVADKLWQTRREILALMSQVFEIVSI